MKSYFLKYSLTLCLLALFALSSFACTIFVLTDSKNTLFFNNEDYSNPSTRIWFLPAKKGVYGTAYLGFDNNYAQGGVNTKGLAFDWVAGSKNKWKLDSTLLVAKGNPSERMLESCATVEEAIAFFKKYRQPSFSYAKILIADKTGASVIIGVKDGNLFFDRSSSSRGFGYGGKMLSNMLSADTKPSLENGLPILNACAQEGTHATKYSNVFNLNSGEISLISFVVREKETITLNLTEELKKGDHYYDLPKIKSQLNLPLMLTKHFLFSSKGIKDKNLGITKNLKRVISGIENTGYNQKDFNPEFWKGFSLYQKSNQNELRGLGRFISLTLMEANDTAPVRNRLYRVKYAGETILQRYSFDTEGRISNIGYEGSE